MKKQTVVSVILALALAAAVADICAAELKPETLKAWEEYKKLTEQRVDRELSSDTNFLMQDFLSPGDRQRCRTSILFDDCRPGKRTAPGPESWSGPSTRAGCRDTGSEESQPVTGSRQTGRSHTKRSIRRAGGDPRAA